MADRLTNKVALIAGASRGIGRAIALRMAEEGAFVVAASRSQGKLEELVEEIESKGGKAEAVVLDIGDLDGYRQTIRDAAAEHGHLDIMVHNAMSGMGAPFLDITSEIWHDNFKLNAEACFVATQESARVMKERGIRGAIVNISSIGGLKVPFGHAAYGASKAAMVHLSRCAALELAPLGIRVNVVAPGMIETDTMYGSFPNKEMEGFARGMIPMGRFGTPTELANGVVFLASDEASFITGEVMLIDGGRFPKM
jgi:NAD(P)-dependent dehydrogenase (short-subunit alcohol dehydrogenase family)